MEQIQLEAPVVFPALTLSDFRPARLVLDLEGSLVVIHLRGTNGELREERIEGEQAVQVMRALNKADLSVKSLHRRILEWLVANRGYQGVIVGLPD